MAVYWSFCTSNAACSTDYSAVIMRLIVLPCFLRDVSVDRWHSVSGVDIVDIVNMWRYSLLLPFALCFVFYFIGTRYLRYATIVVRAANCCIISG